MPNHAQNTVLLLLRISRGLEKMFAITLVTIVKFKRDGTDICFHLKQNFYC